MPVIPWCLKCEEREIFASTGALAYMQILWGQGHWGLSNYICVTVPSGLPYYQECLRSIETQVCATKIRQKRLSLCLMWTALFANFYVMMDSIIRVEKIAHHQSLQRGIIAATGLWWRRVCTLELDGGADGWPMFVWGGHIFLILFRKWSSARVPPSIHNRG